MSVAAGRVTVKVCGLTREVDVAGCLVAGVDLLGFNFWPGSKRYLEPSRAAALVRLVADRAQTVGLFVNAAPDEVARAVETSGVGWVQLHGDEDPSDYRSIGARLIQVVKVGQPLPERSPAAERVLIDAAVAGFGGQGQSFDWKTLPGLLSRYGADALVAGGVTPDNAGELVRSFRPGGVDVASGVEEGPGRKDIHKVAALVRAVKEAAAR